MNKLRATVREGGLVSLPQDVLAEIGRDPGAEVHVEVGDGQVRLSKTAPPRRATPGSVARAQALSRELLADTAPTSVDEFLASRRLEAARELIEMEDGWR